MTTQKRLPILRIISILIALFICAACGFLLLMMPAVGSVFEGSGCLGAKPYQEKIIQEMGQFKLPQSAQNLIADTSGFQDCEVFVSFDMDVADLQNFLKSTHISSVTLSTIKDAPFQVEYEFATPQTKQADWKFDLSRKYLVGEGRYGGDTGTVQTVLIDTESNGRYKVYLVTILL